MTTREEDEFIQARIDEKYAQIEAMEKAYWKEMEENYYKAMETEYL